MHLSYFVFHNNIGNVCDFFHDERDDVVHFLCFENNKDCYNHQQRDTNVDSLTTDNVIVLNYKSLTNSRVFYTFSDVDGYEVNEFCNDEQCDAMRFVK